MCICFFSVIVSHEGRICKERNVVLLEKANIGSRFRSEYFFYVHDLTRLIRIITKDYEPSCAGFSAILLFTIDEREVLLLKRNSKIKVIGIRMIEL